MKKKILYCFLVFFVALLVACNGGKGNNSNLTIASINGVEATINEENKTVSFSVENNIDSFNTENIILNDNITLTVFDDSNHTIKSDNPLKLKLGLNQYYLVLSLKNEESIKENWILNITREELLDEIISEISVKELKNFYKLGEQFEKGVLLVKYNTGKIIEIEITDEMIQNFDTTIEGKKEMTISYQDKTIVYEYEVSDKSLVSINFEPNVKNVYLYGDDTPKIKLEATYDNGEKSIVEGIVNGFDSKKIGKQTINVSYGNKSLQLDIEIINKLINIKVNDLKNVYAVNETFTTGKLDLIYANGDTNTIDLTLDMVSNFDTTTKGNKQMTITYEAFSITYDYKVGKKVIDIDYFSQKNHFVLGAKDPKFNLIATYDDYSKEVVEAEVIGFDSSTKGNKIITLKYAELYYEVSILITDKVTSIKPYYERDTHFLNTAPNYLYIIIECADGTKTDISIPKDYLEGIDTSCVGEKTTTITYEGISMDYKYNVVKPEIENIKLYGDNTIKYGQTNVEFQFEVHSTNTIYYVNLKPINYNPYQLGIQNLKFNYTGYEFEVEFNVINYVTSISIVSLQKEYTYGEEFKNGILSVTYADKSTEQIPLTRDMVYGLDSTTIGPKTIVVKYENASVEYEINVISNSNEVKDVFISELNRYYKVGDSFVNGKLGLIFEDNHTEEVEITKEMISGFDTITTGWKKITITYNGKQITDTILVSNKKYGDFILPNKSDINPDIIQKLFKDLFIRLRGDHNDGFAKWWKVNGKQIIDLINKTGISEDRFINLTKTYDKYIDLLIKIKYDSTYKITYNDINSLKNLTKDLLYNLKTEELGILFLEAMLNKYTSDEIDLSWVFNISDKNILELDFEGLKGKLSENILNMVNNFFNNLVKPVKYDNNLLFKDYCILIDSIKGTLNALINTNTNILYRLVISLKDYKETNKNLSSLVISIKDVLLEVRKSTNNFEGLDKIAEIVLRNHYLISNDKEEVLMLFEALEHFLNHSDFYLDLFNEYFITHIEEISHIKYLDLENGHFSDNLKAIKGYYYIVNIFNRVMDYMWSRNIAFAKNLQAYLMKYTGYNYTNLYFNLTQTANINLDFNNFKNNQDIKNSEFYSSLQELLNSYNETITILKLDIIPILKNTNEEVAKNAIIKYLKGKNIYISSQDLEHVTLKLNEVGEHEIVIPYPNLTIKYLIFEEKEANISIDFNKNQSFLFVQINDLNDNTFENYFRAIDYQLNINFTNKMLSFNLNLNDILYDTNYYYEQKFGLQLVTIEYVTSLGNFYDFNYIGVFTNGKPCIVFLDESLDYYEEIGTVKDKFYFDYYINRDQTSIYGNFGTRYFTWELTEDMYTDMTDGFVLRDIYEYIADPNDPNKYLSIPISITFYKNNSQNNIKEIKIENLSLDHINPEASFEYSTFKASIYHYNEKVEYKYNYSDLNNYLLSTYGFDRISYVLNDNTTKKLYKIDSNYMCEIDLYGYRTDENTKEEVKIFITKIRTQFKAVKDQIDFRKLSFHFETFSLNYQIVNRSDITTDLLFKLISPYVKKMTLIDGATNSDVKLNRETLLIMFYNSLKYASPIRVYETDNGFIAETIDNNRVYFYNENKKDEVASYSVKLIKHVYYDSFELSTNSLEELFTNYYHFVITKYSSEKIILKGKEVLDYFNANNINYYYRNGFYIKIKKGYSYETIEIPVIGSYYLNLRSYYFGNFKEEDFTKENIIDTIIKNNIIFKIHYSITNNSIVDFSLIHDRVIVNDVKIIKGNMKYVEIKFTINNIENVATIFVN